MRFEIAQNVETIVFHRDQRLLERGTQSARLTERQAVLLQMLCTMADRCVSREEYAQAVGGGDWDPRRRLPLDQHIHALRRLGLEIVSKRNVGYELLAAVRDMDGDGPRQLFAMSEALREPDAEPQGMAPVWLDDRGRWLIALPDHVSFAEKMLGLRDPGALAYLLTRCGFVKLYLGTGGLRAVYDRDNVELAALRALHDHLSTQYGYERVVLESVTGESRTFASAAAAVTWMDREHGLHKHLVPGSVIEEALEPAGCEVPEIRDLLDTWEQSSPGEFYDAMTTSIRRARGHKAPSAPVQRVLCVKLDGEGEPYYTEVGPGIYLYGNKTAQYLRGRRVRDQAAPGYAERAAEHYRRVVHGGRPILAKVRSTVQLEHGIRTLAHLRLSLPTVASSGREQAVVARTVNV